jgi:hypothetical protein
MHLVGYFHSCITMHGFMNVKHQTSLCTKTHCKVQTGPLVYLAHIVGYVVLLVVSNLADSQSGASALLQTGCTIPVLALTERWTLGFRERSRRETDQSLLFGSKVMKEWRYTSAPPLFPHGVVRDDFYHHSTSF